MTSRSIKNNKNKGGGVSRTYSKKHKLILIGAIASLGIIILSIGLGVGLSGTSEDSKNPQIDIKEPTEKVTKRDNYQLIEKGKGDTKEVIVRLNEKTTFDQIKTEEEQIKKDLNGKTITELRLPYGTKDNFQTTPEADGATKLDLDKIKNELGIEIEESKVGYVFYPSDETDENKTYQNQKIFEVVLPKTQKNIVDNKFQNNKIRKVNFEELDQLESIGKYSFQNNQFSEKVTIPSNVTYIQYAAFQLSLIKELDLSKAVSLTRLFDYVFENNQISGTIVIPQKLVRIGDSSFQNNKIEYLDLTKAVGLKYINESAFRINNIKELDFSKAMSLEDIIFQAFADNNIEKLNLNAPNLSSIQQEIFKNNVFKDTQKTTDPLADGYVFPKSISLIWSGSFSRPYSVGESKRAVFVPKQISELQNGAFSSGYAVYKAEVDLSIPKYKVEVIDGKNTLTFDSDTTIGDVILRQDLIKEENKKKNIDKYIFPSSTITKFGDGEEFSPTSQRLLGLREYLGLSDAVDAWLSSYIFATTSNPEEGKNYLYIKPGITLDQLAPQKKLIQDAHTNKPFDKVIFPYAQKDVLLKGADITSPDAAATALKSILELQSNTLKNDDYGFKLYPEDYDVTKDYANNRIIEVEFDKNTTELSSPSSTGGNGQFSNNFIEELDLSNTKITFVRNSAFSNNKISKLSLYKGTTRIGNVAFKNNHITDTSFIAELTSLTAVAQEAFADQTDKNDVKETPTVLTTLKSSISFPHSLTRIDSNAFKAAKGITINVSSAGKVEISTQSFGHPNSDDITLNYTT